MAKIKSKAKLIKDYLSEENGIIYSYGIVFSRNGFSPMLFLEIYSEFKIPIYVDMYDSYFVAYGILEKDDCIKIMDYINLNQ